MDRMVKLFDAESSSILGYVQPDAQSVFVSVNCPEFDPPPKPGAEMVFLQLQGALADVESNDDDKKVDLTRKNAQKSYSVSEDAQILSKLQRKRTAERFINLRSLVPIFSRSLMGIQNRSRLLSKLRREDQAYILEFAEKNPDDAHCSYFLWKKSSMEGRGGGQECLEITTISKFRVREVPDRVIKRRSLKNSQKVLQCDQIMGLLMSGALKEDEYFSQSSELSWVHSPPSQTRGSEAAETEKLSPEKELEAKTQMIWDQDLMFLGDLLQYLVKNKKMSPEAILQLAQDNLKDSPDSLAKLRQIVEIFKGIEAHKKPSAT